jgi:hypothetical protein
MNRGMAGLAKEHRFLKPSSLLFWHQVVKAYRIYLTLTQGANPAILMRFIQHKLKKLYYMSNIKR